MIGCLTDSLEAAVFVGIVLSVDCSSSVTQ